MFRTLSRNRRQFKPVKRYLTQSLSRAKHEPTRY